MKRTTKTDRYECGDGHLCNIAPLALAGIGALAGGVLGGLSGGGDKNQKSSQQGSSSTSSTWSPWGEVAPLYSQFAQEAGNLFNQGVQPFYGGQLFAGPSGATQQGWQLGMGSLPMYQGAASAAQGGAPWFKQAAEKALQATDAMRGINRTAGGNYNFLSNAANVANNPYVQGMNQMMARRMNENLAENILPQLGYQGAGVGQFGNERMGALQGRAIGDTQQAIADAQAQINAQAYQSGLGAQQYALGQTGNVLQNQLAPAQAQAWGAQQQGNAANLLNQAGQYQQNAQNAAMGVGQSQEGYDQNQLNQDFMRWQWEQQAPYTRLQNLAQSLGFLQPLGTMTSGSSSMNTGTAPNPNYQSTGQRIIGGALAGMGLGAFSDRRLKRNIARAGATPGGQPWYTWEWVWGGKGQGVMADEVPDDVRLAGPFGYAMVDYSKVI